MDNDQKRDEQELVGSDVNVSGREMDRRHLEPGDTETQPTYGIEESDLGATSAEVQPDPVAFTDADPMSVQEETVTVGRPVQVENVTETYVEPSPAGRTAASARMQANVAADAFRRGEFMRDATIDPAANNDDRLIALLSYATQILIPFVMPALVLFSESSKTRPFQRFHAVQSLALSAVLVLLAIFIGIGTAIVSIVPVIGWLVAAVVACLSPIMVLMAWFALVYYGYQAYQGKRFAIPGLSSFLKDQGWI
jgi:uncharacterized membrane protein